MNVVRLAERADCVLLRSRPYPMWVFGHEAAYRLRRIGVGR